MSVKHTVYNPNILATVIGLAFCTAHVHMPDAANTFLNYLGGICTPMSMVVVGSTLASGSITAGLRNRVIMESVVSRNMLIPLITAGIALLLPVDPFMKGMLVLGSLFPAATVVVLMSKAYGQDDVFASELLVISTLLSMVTLPAGVMLINSFII